ncbi:MAG: flavin reductase family protein [Lachnospiraceae bacterium]|nr:NADH-FMN oxidoreductase RutF, flavin reductase (DIM6/NTAB) family [Lachnospiraceae bacterium XPB1003]
MSKIEFKKPGNFVYPVPAVLVSCAGADGNKNIITVAWTGTVCSDPPMVYISVRKERFSYDIIKESGEFVINLPDEKLAHALDYCGCTTGAKVDKFKECALTAEESSKVSVPSIAESPVAIECKVKDIIPLGTHDMFLAEVLAVRVDDRYIDEKGAFHMDDVKLIAYEHGQYRALGAKLGSFGYSVKKKKSKGRKNHKRKDK